MRGRDVVRRLARRDASIVDRNRPGTRPGPTSKRWTRVSRRRRGPVQARGNAEQARNRSWHGTGRARVAKDSQGAEDEV